MDKNKVEYIKAFKHPEVERQDYSDLFESIAMYVSMEQGAEAEDILEEGFVPLDPEAYEKRYIELMYNTLKRTEEIDSDVIVRMWTRSFPVRRSNEGSRNGRSD